MDRIKLTDDYNKYFTEIGRDKIFHHTIQILVKGGIYKYKPWGTGVFVEINNYCYILTASHVTENQTGLYTITKNGIVLINGDLRETDLEFDKKIDVAYIKLDKKTTEILKSSFTVLPQNKILLSHLLEDTTSYIVLGYPEKNIKVENNIIKTGAEHILTTIAKDKVYEHYKYDKLTNYLINYAGKGFDLITNNKKKINLEPHGISGCGLWYLSFNGDLENFVIDYFLIGIMTDYIKSPYFVLAGTAIDVIIADIIPR